MTHSEHATASSDSAAPPSCAAMVEYGDCVDTDDLCETIQHPLSYYGASLERTPDDRLVDWRGQ